jgi:uncharacterized membrane protein YeaQ/YmgE (transglycosylase-associated protein family)
LVAREEVPGMEGSLVIGAISPTHLILWLIIGLVAGWLAGQVMSGHGYGVVGDIVVGLVGALIGGFLVNHFLHKSFGFIGSLIVAFIGALILVAILHLVRGESIRTAT